jgi:hypothetical protein
VGSLPLPYRFGVRTDAPDTNAGTAIATTAASATIANTILWCFITNLL